VLVHNLDLPGHGQRVDDELCDLTSLVDDIEQQCNSIKQPNRPVILVCWSLSGLAGLLISKKPALIDGLALISSSPCFVTRDNWSCGIESEIFDEFAQSLQSDFSGTIRRFLSLQVKGSASGREVLRSLREKILQQPQPTASSLNAGLSILKETDLRDLIPDINLPVCWVLGGQDGLVKVGLVNALSAENANMEFHVYEKSGHAPFLSDTEKFVKHLVDFLSQFINKQ
jgi:pimeloyl-[acyl-carrier protein] methyl ester esterase